MREPFMTSYRAESVQSDEIAMDHADAVCFVWEMAERNGGLLLAYDSSTWTAAWYEGALGRTLDAEELASVRALGESRAVFRTVPGVVGRPLAALPPGEPVLEVRGRVPGFTLSYGVDGGMNILGSLLTEETPVSADPE